MGALNAPKKKSKNRIASLRAAISLGHNAQGTHSNGGCGTPGSPQLECVLRKPPFCDVAEYGEADQA